MVAIFAVNNSSNALVISSGGPDSMISLSGRPWPSKLLKHVGRDKLTYVANHIETFESFAGKVQCAMKPGSRGTLLLLGIGLEDGTPLFVTRPHAHMPV